MVQLFFDEICLGCIPEDVPCIYEEGERGPSNSAFLCAPPGGWCGVARLLDFAGAFDAYHISRDEAEADGHAILWDWYATGGGMYEAIKHCEASMP